MVTLFVAEKTEAKTAEKICPPLLEVVNLGLLEPRFFWLLCLNSEILVLDSGKSPNVFLLRIYFGYSFNTFYYLVSNLLEMKIVTLERLISTGHVAKQSVTPSKDA